MKTVVFYDHSKDASMEQFIEVFPLHEAWEKQFLDSGKILGTGAFAIPGEGAMAIFTDKESAEKFVAGDPFVKEGLVCNVKIKEWHDELA